MRLLRALIHALVALAFVTATVAQARMLSGVPEMAGRPIAHATAVHGASHHETDCAASATAEDHATHKREVCQTACCFALAQTLGRTGEAGLFIASSAARYLDLAQPLTGRAGAPEPGVPKRDV